MDDNFKDILREEEGRLKDLSVSFSSISKEIYKSEYDLARLEKRIAKASKKNIDALIDEKNALLVSLDKYKKNKENVEKFIHDQAMKNILSRANAVLTYDEKIYLQKKIKEKAIYDTTIKYTKETDEEQKKILKNKIDGYKKVLNLLEEEEKINAKNLDYDKKRLELEKKIKGLEKVGDKKGAKSALIERKKLILEAEKDALNEDVANNRISKEEYDSRLKYINKQERSLHREESLSKFVNEELPRATKRLIDGIKSSLSTSLNSAIDDVVSHRTKVMARLQGFGGDEYDYTGLTSTMARSLSTSPYITQKAFIAKLDEAVDKGIAYNVEQRTFLSTISESIATTFDAFDSNLMRIIRLQQADSTAARLGMEAALTKTFNQVFSDTSYLSDMYDSVTAAIVDSEATMSRERATEFEYTVQKWLGSLYSLGASSELISQIAQGLNYLGTGNVQALASNSPLQTLFAMSASRAEGLDYADLLVQGLDASNTNKLMKAMVEYLKEIAVTNRANNVVKAAYGDLYNMSLADMRAITSLSSTDISSIYSQNLDYSGMQTELSSQFNSISNRYSQSEKLSNVIENFMYTLGSGIATDAFRLVTWKVADFVENATGGTHLPSVFVHGWGVDLSPFTLEGIAKAAVIGGSGLSQIGNILSSLSSDNKSGLNLSVWGGLDKLQRGQIETTTAGSIQTTSGSMGIGSSSSSDIKKSSLSSIKDESSDVSEVMNADQEDEYTANDIYVAMYKDKTPVPVAVDMDNGLGYLLMQLANQMLSVNRVTDVNIKKADIQVPTVVTQMDNKFKEEIRNYIKSTYIELLADELRTSLIGQTKGFGGATIAKVCDKIMNDKVDVEVRNNNFDRFLDLQSGIFG
ncbi:MAG: hypothetical protein J6T10_16175 [Methanobrevibacter sp.]|nr:hypothetical protein [Methanobrevibacter sp.]